MTFVMTPRQLKLRQDMQKLVDKFVSDTGSVPTIRVGHRGYWVEIFSVEEAPQLYRMLKGGEKQ